MGQLTNTTSYTVADAKSYAAKYAAEIRDSYEKTGLPLGVHLKEAGVCLKLWEVWQAGCFLMFYLKDVHGCEESVAHRIGFAHGQRSLFGDPWEWAVRYLNEYVQNNCVKDQPGKELADEISNEVLGSAFER